MTLSSPLSISTKVKLNSGHEMPILGYGCYELDKPVEGCLAALKAGYRHLDSARFYQNEEALAEALRLSGLERDSIFITTKVFGNEHGYDACKRAVLDSVTPPKPECWDLILVHEPTSGPEKRIEAYRAIAEAQKAGKAKSIGVSNFGVHQLKGLEEANVGPTPAVNQMELHPWCQHRSIVEYCRSKGIVLQAYCPLVRGKYMKDPTLVKVVDKVGRTPAQVLLRWSLQHGFVPLPKSDKPERIKENTEIFDFELDAESMALLDSLDLGDKGAICGNRASLP